MRYNFQDKKILVVNDSDYSRKMLIGILKVMMVGEVDEAYEATQAYRMANDKKYDTILADISNGASDAIPLAKSINTRADSKHPGTPVVAICGPRALAFMDRAREAGVVDLIQAPYSTDVIAQKLNFIIDLNADQLENHAKPEQGMVLNDYSENDTKISDKNVFVNFASSDCRVLRPCKKTFERILRGLFVSCSRRFGKQAYHVRVTNFDTAA